MYGTNYRWWWYDNGCGAGSDIMPALTTNIANVIGLQIPGLLLAIGQGLFTAVIDPSGWIGFLDKPIEHATASVAAGVWFPFLSLDPAAGRRRHPAAGRPGPAVGRRSPPPCGP